MNFQRTLYVAVAIYLTSLFSTFAQADSPVLRISAYSLSFGNVKVGTTSLQTAYITWVCNESIDCTGYFSTSITGAADFTIARNYCNGNYTVKAGSSRVCQIDVDFRPTSAGSKAGQINNGSTCPSTKYCANVSLSGTGVDNPPPPPSSASLPIIDGTPRVSQPSCSRGSIINVDSQILAESIPVIGTPFSLYYSTDKVPGHLEGFRIHIPVFGSISNGYTRTVYAHGGGINQSTTDGPTQLNTAMDITTWTGGGATKPQDLQIDTTDTKSGAATVNSTVHVAIGQYDARIFGLGGLMPSKFAVYDKIGKRIYWGNGTTEKVNLYYSSDSPNWYYKADYDKNLVYAFDYVTGYLYAANDLYTRDPVFYWKQDGNGNLTSYEETTKSGQPNRVTTFTRTSSGVTITAPFGQVTNLAFNSDGWTTYVTQPDNYSFQMTYVDAGGLLASFQKPGGQKSSFTYSSTGLLTKDTDANGVSSSFNKTVYSNGWVVDKTSALGILERYQTSSTDTDETNLSLINGQVSGTVTHLAYPWKYTKDVYAHYANSQKANGPLYGEADAAVNSTWEQFEQGGYGYAQFQINRSVTTTGTPQAFTKFTTTKHSVYGTNGPGDVTETYDVASRIATLAGPGFKTIRGIGYSGRVESIQEGPYVPYLFSYNNLGQLSSSGQTGRATNYTYNSQGYLSSATDNAGLTTSFTYDAAGRVLTKTDPNQYVTTYSYTANGKLASVTPSGKSAHNFSYNLSDLVTSYVPAPLGGSIGNITYTYDGDGRPKRVQTAVAALDYTYGTGLLNSIQGPNYARQFLQRDGDYLTDSATAPDNIHTKQEHWGNLLSRETTDIPNVTNGSVRFEYDNVLRLSKVAVQQSGSDVNAISYAYDSSSRATTIGSATVAYSSTTNRPTTVTQGQLTLAYTYDDVESNSAARFGDLERKDVSLNGSHIFDLLLIRDGQGRINQYTTNQGTPSVVSGTYGYDSSGRLQTVYRAEGKFTYNYDGNGNRSSVVTPNGTIYATYDAQDRLTAYGNYRYTYTDNGERASKVDVSVSPNRYWFYGWDDFGQLRYVNTPDNNRIVFSYDVRGRRIGYSINGVMQRVYVYLDQTRIAAEIDPSSNKIIWRFVYGLNGQTPDYAVSPILGTVRLITDHVGSIRKYISTDGGTLNNSTNYDEFGNLIPNNPPQLDIGFAGGLTDPYSNLVHFGAREYDPEIGRFISRDPILFGGLDTNVYNYSLNDPVNFVDPSGMIFQNLIAKNYDPNQQLLIGAGLSAAGAIALRVGYGLSVANPTLALSLIAAGSYLGYEGGQNLIKARSRGAPQSIAIDLPSISDSPTSCPVNGMP